MWSSSFTGFNLCLFRWSSTRSVSVAFTWSALTDGLCFRAVVWWSTPPQGSCGTSFLRGSLWISPTPVTISAAWCPAVSRSRLEFSVGSNRLVTLGLNVMFVSSRRERRSCRAEAGVRARIQSPVRLVLCADGGSRSQSTDRIHPDGPEGNGAADGRGFGHGFWTGQIFPRAQTSSVRLASMKHRREISLS